MILHPDQEGNASIMKLQCHCIQILTRTIGTDPKQFRRIQNKDKASVYFTKITVASRSINHIIPVYIALVFPTKLKKVFHQCMIGTDY